MMREGEAGKVRFACAAITALVLVVAVPGSASGAYDFGDNLGDQPNQSMPCVDCTMWNLVLHPASTAGTIGSPIDGVLVSFTIKKAASSPVYGLEPIRARVIASAGSNSWRGGGASDYVIPSAAAGLQTFPSRIPIGAGDRVGFDDDPTVNGAIPLLYDNAFAACVTIQSPRLPLAGGAAFTPECNAQWEALIRGRVEPDADHDTFGDETQDRCPGRAGPNEGCPPAKKCKRKKHRAASAKKKKHCKKRKKRR